MTGARIRIDVTGIDSAERRLGSLALAGEDLRPLFVGSHTENPGKPLSSIT